MVLDTNILIAYLKGEPGVVDDDRLAEIAAGFSRLYRLRLPDAAIAATAAAQGMPLVTRDRGFRKVHEIRLIEM
jgi:predicted nucleic acid-binding protein